MYTLNLYSTLGDHIGRHRRIDTAAKQTHCSATYTGRKATGARLRRPVDISGQITHLNINSIFRLVYIDLTGGVRIC
jgi:hypothetical protein